MESKICEIWNPTGKALAAKSWQRGDRGGYAPLCENKFKTGVCLIKKGAPNPCRNCENKKIRAVSPGMIRENMRSDARERLGIYPLIGSDKTAWIAADIDAHTDGQDPEALIESVRDISIAIDVPVSVFRSQSGRGYHAYIFFSEIVPAYKARALILALIERAGGMAHDSASAEAFDAVFPKQDALNHLDMGNLIALPFNGFSWEVNRGSCYVPPDGYSAFSSIEENAEYFVEEGYQPLSENDMDALLSMMDVDSSVPKKNRAAAGGKSAQPAGEKRLTKITSDCAFLAHCEADSATLSEPEWFCMVQVLAREYGGPALIHALSKDYPGYTSAETDAKIIQVLNSQPGPLTCEKIKTIWDCGKDCGVKCPVHLASSTQSTRRTEGEVAEDEWISNILFGSQATGGALLADARRFSSYFLGKNGGDTEKTTEYLSQWNDRNAEKISPELIGEIVATASESRGRADFSQAIGFSVSSLERYIYPDGKITYQLYVSGFDSPVPLVFDDFCSGAAFQKKFGLLVNQLCDVPSGKGSKKAWQEIVNPLLRESVDVHVPEDETELAAMRGIIEDGLRAFRDMENPIIEDLISERVVIHEDNILFSLSKMMQWVKFNPELSKMTRKEIIGNVLRPLGFRNSKDPVRIGKKRVRVWLMSVADFEIEVV